MTSMARVNQYKAGPIIFIGNQKIPSIVEESHEMVWIFLESFN